MKKNIIVSIISFFAVFGQMLISTKLKYPWQEINFFLLIFFIFLLTGKKDSSYYFFIVSSAFFFSLFSTKSSVLLFVFFLLLGRIFFFLRHNVFTNRSLYSVLILYGMMFFSWKIFFFFLNWTKKGVFFHGLNWVYNGEILILNLAFVFGIVHLTHLYIKKV